jgi:hypothetical protein
MFKRDLLQRTTVKNELMKSKRIKESERKYSILRQRLYIDGRSWEGGPMSLKQIAVPGQGGNSPRRPAKTDERVRLTAGGVACAARERDVDAEHNLICGV